MSELPEPAVCARCGASFTPRADLLERYPGWRPKECPRCYRAARRDTADARGAANGDTAGARRRGGAGSPGTGRAKSGGRSRGGIEENLRVAEVLERYTDGPDTGVFTDGSSIPNPGPGGWGAVYVVDGRIVDQAYGYDPLTTNNRMELTALLAAIELVPQDTPATIYTDSNLAVQTITQWAAGWEKRGWKRKTGPVENLDLVRPLYERLLERPELTLAWIKAHAGNRWNEYADSLSTAWARDEL